MLSRFPSQYKRNPYRKAGSHSRRRKLHLLWICQFHYRLQSGCGPVEFKSHAASLSFRFTVQTFVRISGLSLAFLMLFRRMTVVAGEKLVRVSGRARRHLIRFLLIFVKFRIWELLLKFARVCRFWWKTNLTLLGLCQLLADITGGILFKILVLGINEMVLYFSSEVLKGCSLFLIYKTNIFIKLLKHLMPMWLYIFLFIFVGFGLFLLVGSLLNIITEHYRL